MARTDQSTSVPGRILAAVIADEVNVSTRTEPAPPPRQSPLGTRSLPTALRGWSALGCLLLLTLTSGLSPPVAARPVAAAPAPTVSRGLDLGRNPADAPNLVAAPNRGGPNIKSTSGIVKSTNWAGFAVSGKGVTFTNVVGSWVQPSAICPTNAAEAASFWVGLDGFLKTSSTVEQIGTDSDCDKANKKEKIPGGATYYAWYEIYPSLPVSITEKSSTGAVISDGVYPGDEMTADVSGGGGSFTLTLTDDSRGWSFTTVQSTSAQQSSAEWIAEDPSGCNGCSSGKLAEFGDVTFSGLTVTASATPFNQAQINMYKGKTERAATGSEVNGSSFTVMWDHT